MAAIKPRTWHWSLITGGLVALFCGIVWMLVPSRPDSTKLLKEARVAIDRSDTATATRILETILASDPGNGTALLYQGQLARDLGDREAARACWRRIPDQPFRIGGTARYCEGTLLLELHKAHDAEQMLTRAATLHQTYVQPHERLLELYVLQNRDADVRTQLLAIQELRSLTLDELALQIVPSGQFRAREVSVKQLRAFVEADPDDISSQLALLQYSREEGRNQQVADRLRQLRLRHPADDRLLALLIDVHLDQREFAAAEALCAQRAVEDTADDSLLQSLARFAMEKGDWEPAARICSKVVELAPENLTANYRLGLALQRSGRGRAARPRLLRAELLDRLERQAARISHGNRQRTELLLPIVDEVGRILARLDRHAEAARWFAQALLLNPDDPAALDGYRVASARLENAATERPSAVVDRLANRTPSRAPDIPTERPQPPAAASSPADKPHVAKTSLIRFTDVHERAGIDFQFFNGETGFKYLLEGLGGGVAVLDYDVDGWPDLYFPQGCRLPFDPQDHAYTDRMYRNLGNGSFQDVTASARLGDNQYSQGCAAGDFDNDGDPDLVIANFGATVFYVNNGDGTFTGAADAAGIRDGQWSSSAAFADLDRDGNLDLYVVKYLDSLRVCRTADGRVSTCDPQNSNAEQDVLYRNAGDGKFVDVTASSGIVAPNGKGLGIVVADLDDDGWPDIYVANDGTPNFLFRNTGSGLPASAGSGLRFVEQGLASGAALNGDGKSEAGMGIACADLNGDGRLDLYVTNFYLESNTLYLNQGHATFADGTRRAGLAAPTMPMLGFGTQAADFDRDGAPELIVANGHIDDFRFRGEPWKMPPQLFRNLGHGEFADVSSDCGPYFQGKYLGRGVARLDYNRDGLADVVIVHQDRPVALLENATAAAGHGLTLELHGTTSNRDAIGARIRILAGGVTQVLEICGGDGYCATNERRQCLGLGTATRVDELEVRWPAGSNRTWTDLRVDRDLVLIEGSDALIVRSDRRP